MHNQFQYQKHQKYEKCMLSLLIRDGRLMSENSKGVVINQADNRYNLILLGMLSAYTYLIKYQETLPVKQSFAF